MIKLAKLEFKKFGFSRYVKGALIATLIIAGLFIAIIFSERTSGDGGITTGISLHEQSSDLPSSYAGVFRDIGSLVNITFVVFASVLIAKLIIGEYKNKTITLLFTYPVNRKKLLATKLMIVSLFALFASLFANLVTSSLFCLFNHYYDFIDEPLTQGILVKQLIGMVLYSIANAGICLIPVYFGMRKKSVPATILSSILLVTLVMSNNGGFSLSDFVAIPLSVAAIGVLVAWWTIRNVEHTDVV